MWTKFNWFNKRVAGYCWHGHEHSVGAHQVCVTARSNCTLRYRQNICSETDKHLPDGTVS